MVNFDCIDEHYPTHPLCSNWYFENGQTLDKTISVKCDGKLYCSQDPWHKIKDKTIVQIHLFILVHTIGVELITTFYLLTDQYRRKTPQEIHTSSKSPLASSTIASMCSSIGILYYLSSNMF